MFKPLRIFLAVCAMLAGAGACALEMPPANSSGDTCRQIQGRAANAYDIEKRLINKMNEFQKNVATNEKSCLSKYSNMSVAAKAGLPSASAFLSGITKELERQACQTIDSAVAEASQLTGKSATLPMGMGYVNVGTFYNTGVGSTSTVGGVPVQTTVTDTGVRAGSSAVNSGGTSVLQKIKNLFF